MTTISTNINSTASGGFREFLTIVASVVALSMSVYLAFGNGSLQISFVSLALWAIGSLLTGRIMEDSKTFLGGVYSVAAMVGSVAMMVIGMVLLFPWLLAVMKEFDLSILLSLPVFCGLPALNFLRAMQN